MASSSWDMSNMFGSMKIDLTGIIAGSTNNDNAYVPIIDISSLTVNGMDKKKTIEKISKACEEVGFMVITGHGISQDVIDSMWSITGEFFDLAEDQKAKSMTMTSDYPYGYEKGEVLSAGKDKEKGETVERLPDFKETFTIGPNNQDSGMPARVWPEEPKELASIYKRYYEAMEGLSGVLLKAMAVALDMPENWFEDKIDHHMCALRALNYPDQSSSPPLPGQTRAGAHTDYGSLTILKSGGPGLQVRKDIDGRDDWVDVPHVGDGFVINLGDLMRRWTNDKWSSTLHRVVNPPQDGKNHRRQSVAFFHNLNGDAVVSTIESCRDEEGGSGYEDIVAKDFLMMKHLASVKNVVKEEEGEEGKEEL
ncbi:hypothetical protein TL16_g12600 [Triparma laevis f. inornata]|uniref:Fe2OG dioxygenase domain-containing protein n=1 Tax=Triparma laevis f. inornata TaxID=1714386 RepID=A0A9W7EVJ3_9STRA|nr:hypothetical protein TL16_g12600 [Triparma laevis f. inornata]